VKTYYIPIHFFERDNDDSDMVKESVTEDLEGRRQ
jgi:hypothetical protein